MNNDLGASKKLAKQVAKLVKKHKVKGTKVIIAPTSVNLERVSKATKKSKVKVAAQNMHFAESGAFTGEISASMLKSIDVKTVILGHSERREYFGEDDALKTPCFTLKLQRSKILFWLMSLFGPLEPEKLQVQSKRKTCTHLSEKHWQTSIA